MKGSDKFWNAIGIVLYTYSMYNIFINGWPADTKKMRI